MLTTERTVVQYYTTTYIIIRAMIPSDDVDWIVLF